MKYFQFKCSQLENIPSPMYNVVALQRMTICKDYKPGSYVGLGCRGLKNHIFEDIPIRVVYTLMSTYAKGCWYKTLSASWPTDSLGNWLERNQTSDRCETKRNGRKLMLCRFQCNQDFCLEMAFFFYFSVII